MLEHCSNSGTLPQPPSVAVTAKALPQLPSFAVIAEALPQLPSDTTITRRSPYPKASAQKPFSPLRSANAPWIPRGAVCEGRRVNAGSPAYRRSAYIIDARETRQ
jgi:hypothetical protein